MRTRTGISNPDIADLAERMAVSERTVYSRINRLVEAGWINRIKGGGYQVRGWKWICKACLGASPKLRIETGGAEFSELGLKKATFLAMISWLNRIAVKVNDYRHRARKRGVRSEGSHLEGLAGSLLAKRTGMSRQWVSKWIGRLVKDKVLRRKFQWETLHDATAWDVVQARSDANQFEWTVGLRISPAGTVFRMKPSLLTPLIDVNAIRRMPRKPSFKGK